jgi:hypothetical protein
LARAISGSRHPAARLLVRNNPENEAPHLGSPWQ